MNTEKKLSIRKFLEKKPTNKSNDKSNDNIQKTFKELPSLESMNGMSWINESQKIDQAPIVPKLQGYSNALKSGLYQQPIKFQQPLYQQPLYQNQQLPIQDLNVPKSQTIKELKKRCYTCKPRSHVLLHIISESNCKNFVFHHDMNNRPIIIVSPKIHAETLTDLPFQLQINLFESIKFFCGLWNIKDYEIAWNCGSWQQRPHFHIKIKTSEKIINKMRDLHFRTKLEIKENKLETKKKKVEIKENK